MKSAPFFCSSHDVVIVWDELNAQGQRTGQLNLYVAPFRSRTENGKTHEGWHSDPVPCQAWPEMIQDMVKNGVVLAAIEDTKTLPPRAVGLTCYLLNLAAVKLDDNRVGDGVRMEQERVLEMANHVLTERYKQRLGKDVQIEQIIESLIQDSGH